MDLELTADQVELRRAVHDFLERECPLETVRRVVDDAAPAEHLWKAMADLDWPGLAIEEAYGGVGLGFAEVAVVAEELGGFLAPVPFLPTVSQFVPAVREAGTEEQRRRFLEPVAAAGATGALAFADDPSRWQISDLTSRANRSGNTWTISATKHAVMASADIDELVVAARIGDDPLSVGLFLLPAASAEFQPVQAVDATRPLSRVILDSVPVPADRVLGEPGSAAVSNALARTLQEATVALALETVGAARSLFDRVVSYTRERRQFGVPIGSFQAVKHKLADLYVEVQRAEALCWYGVAALSEDDPDRALAASMAKAASDDCQRKVCKEAIQTFGGIAFTWEHEAHLFVKRATSSGALFGSAPEHRLAVARSLNVPST